MGTFTEAEWKSTRTSEAEGSGIAKAIKAFNAAWPNKLSDVDGKTAEASFRAIDAFEEALKKAKGKCDKIKKPDPKKQPTLTLIKNWGDDLKVRRTTLQTAIDKKHEQVLAEIEEKREKDRSNIKAYVLDGFNNSVGEALKQSGEKLDDMEKAIGKSDLAAAYKAQTDVSKKLRTVGTQFSNKAVNEKIGYALQSLKLTDKLLVKTAECTPKEFAAWKKSLKAMNDRLEALEAEMDRVEQSASEPDSDQATGTPAYKKNLKTCIANYKSVVTTCDKTLTYVNQIADRTKRLETQLPDLPPEMRPKAQEAAGKIHALLAEAEADMKTEVEKIRNSGGSYVALKQDYGITKEDETKFLMPVLNKMFSRNLRAIKVIVDTREKLEDMLPA